MRPTNPNVRLLRFDPLPQTIHIDTSFFIHAIINDYTPRHTASENFFRRLIKEKRNITFSSVVFYEFWNAAIKIRIKVKEGIPYTNINLPSMMRNEFEKVEIHQETVSKDIALLFDLLNKFDKKCLIVHPNKEIMNEALRIHYAYAMGLMDSIHVSTLRIAKEDSIAAYDRYIENVLGISVWCWG